MPLQAYDTTVHDNGSRDIAVNNNSGFLTQEVLYICMSNITRDYLEKTRAYFYLLCICMYSS